MLTVLIATYNGAKTLPDVLAAHCRLQAPTGGWKLVVVDNGSRDSAPAIIRSFQSRLPLTYRLEPRRGKNRALNTGLNDVSGDLVVFTDDDAIPRPDWLVQIRRAADDHQDFTIFGGTIVPRWETPPPDWLLTWVPLGPTLTLSDPRLEEGPVRPGLVFGPNMAIRTLVFEAGHRFHEDIGPRGTWYAMGGETEMILRLTRAGYRSWYCKAAQVEHIIRSSQFQKRWVLERAVRFGRGQYRLTMENAARPPALIFGVPRYLIRRLLVQIFRLLRAIPGRAPDESFRERWELHYLIGCALEARRIRRRRADCAKNPDSPGRHDRTPVSSPRS